MLQIGDGSGVTLGHIIRFRYCLTAVLAHVDSHNGTVPDCNIGSVIPFVQYVTVRNAAEPLGDRGSAAFRPIRSTNIVGKTYLIDHIHSHR